MTPHAYKVFETANEFDNDEDRAIYLSESRNYVIDSLIKMAYNDTITWELPEGEPPFQPSEFDAHGNIYHEIKRIERIFLTGTMPGMKAVQRENLFIGVLEYLDKDDARLLIAAKDKKFHKLFKNLSKKFIKETFPELV